MHYAKQVEEAKKSYKNQDDKKEKIRLTRSEFLSGFRKDDKLMPVITVVVYLGASVWDGPMSIHDMLSTRNENLLRFVPDYRIHLIAPAHMADEDFLKFKTDFGKVLQYIKYSKDKDKLYQVTHEDDRFKDVEKESADLINVVTGSELKYKVKGDRVNMCMAIDEMRKESENIGSLATLASLVKKGQLSPTAAAEEAKMSLTEFQIKTAGMKVEEEETVAAQ